MKTLLTLVAGLVLLAGLVALGVWWADREQNAEPAASTSPAHPPSAPAVGETPPASRDASGFLYGRVTSDEGVTYQGRLRWGGDEEAFWDDYFNGTKIDNPWAARVPPDELPTERRPITLFGIELAVREKPVNLTRPFMARFGDVARIDVEFKDLRATLKSGTVVDLDRMGSDDVGDGLWVWDEESGIVELGDWQIRSVELFPTPGSLRVPQRLHGTVRTEAGDRFTGSVAWNRTDGLVTDGLDGITSDGEEVSSPFGTIRSITRDPGARESGAGVRLTLADGREMSLTGSSEAGDRHRGVYVDDPRYGRVLVSWDAFEGVVFSAGGSGPAYGDFPPGRPLAGRVTTRDGRRLAGRLVYDLDESETTETLDAPSRGVNYTIPFGLVASIRPAGGDGGAVTVILHNGERLRLQAAGDLGAKNAGLLIFADEGGAPVFVPWGEVGRIDLDRPLASYPPLAE